MTDAVCDRQTNATLQNESNRMTSIRRNAIKQAATVARTQMNDRDRALGTIAARSEAAQARKARLNNNFRNAVKGTLACDGISEEQENTLLALLHVTETRCYTDAEYQVHVDVIKALAATPTRPADYFF